MGSFCIYISIIFSAYIIYALSVNSNRKEIFREGRKIPP